MPLLHFYRKPAVSKAKIPELLSIARERIASDITGIETEYCFNIETTGSLTDNEKAVLRWLLSETFEQGNFGEESFLTPDTNVIAGNETTKQSRQEEIASPSARNDICNMGTEGIEPSRLSAHDPKSCLSASSSMSP